MQIFEQFKPAKPGYFNWEIELIDDKGKPVSEADAKAYWAKKYGIATYNGGIEAAAKQAAHCIGVETLLATHVAMEIRRLKK